VLNGLDEVGSGTARTLWRINDVFQGHLIQDETFGNGAKTTYGYEPHRRWLENIQTTLDKEQIQSLEYTHFTNGRVHGLNAAGGVPVEYGYDNLNRLSSVSTVSDVPTGTLYNYDDIGNLTGRGATITTYLGAHPHLVDKVGDNSYINDLNGNVTFRGGPDVPGGSQSLTYTPFDLPRLIATATSDTTQRTTQLDYSADEERLVRRDVDTSTLHFVSDLYQRKFDTFDTTLEERFRLYAGDRQLGEIVRKDGTDKTLYFHTDHLGSTDTISDSTGASTTQHFDPFGAPIAPPNPELTRVGFTGQDQDADLGFTDMKGRMYDPLAGRFTSADPVMQAPFWSQGLNAYSYAFNDPINNTDPSGFDASGNIAGGAVITGHAIAAGLIYAGFGGTFGGAILGGLESGGNVGTSICFELDDGSLPAVEIANLLPQEVAAIYRKVRASSTVRGTPSFWDEQTGSDRPLDDVPNAALLVAERRAAAFHFVTDGLPVSGVALPCLGVQVFQDIVAVDYRMGPEWDSERVFAFFQWLRAVLESTRGGRLEVAAEGPPDPVAFSAAWDAFLKS
jgi:RHS repeat-associated protein